MATICNLKLNNLDTPGFCERVTSGVRRLLLVPLIDVESINATVSAQPDLAEDYVVIGSGAMTDKAVLLKSGCEFAEIATSRDMGELKYAVQGNTTGNRSMHATLEIHHTGFRRRLLGFVGVAANLEFLVLVQLSNGNWHLLGDMDRGATLADGTEATSGKASADQNGATLTFEYDCPMPRIMYEGWTPDDPVRGVEMFRTAWLLADEDGIVLTDENGVPIEIPVL